MCVSEAICALQYRGCRITFKIHVLSCIIQLIESLQLFEDCHLKTGYHTEGGCAGWPVFVLCATWKLSTSRWVENGNSKPLLLIHCIVNKCRWGGGRGQILPSLKVFRLPLLNALPDRHNFFNILIIKRRALCRHFGESKHQLRFQEFVYVSIAYPWLLERGVQPLQLAPGRVRALGKNECVLWHETKMMAYIVKVPGHWNVCI